MARVLSVHSGPGALIVTPTPAFGNLDAVDPCHPCFSNDAQMGGMGFLSCVPAVWFFVMYMYRSERSRLSGETMKPYKYWILSTFHAYLHMYVHVLSIILPKYMLFSKYASPSGAINLIRGNTWVRS